jgi:hypothetical protein
MTRCPAHGIRFQQTPARAVNQIGASPQPDCRRTIPYHPHAQPRRTTSGGIRHSSGIKQPGRLPHQRRQGRPIQGNELGPFGEQQQGVCAAGGMIGIGHQLPAAITTPGRQAQDGGDLAFAHLGIHDRQHCPFLQQIPADSDRRRLPCVVGVGFVDAVGRRPYTKPSAPLFLPVTVPNSRFTTQWAMRSCCQVLSSTTCCQVAPPPRAGSSCAG